MLPKKPLLFLVSLWLLQSALFAQIQPLQVPQTPSLQSMREENQRKIRQQNQRLIQQATRNAQAMRAEVEQVKRDLREHEARQPSPEYLRQKQIYSTAFAELKAMLEGKQKADVKRAVFTVENAYLKQELVYEDFCKQVAEWTQRCRLRMKQQGYNAQSPDQRMLALVEVLADTLAYDSRGKQVSYPLQYDFQDALGIRDWTQSFVVKLLKTRTGQCHSLPLLYKIVANELQVKAYLSFAPSHSFIQFKDEQGNLRSFETTNGHFVSKSWITGSGYVKAAAVKNKVFLDTLGLKQTIAYCLQDLAIGYAIKFGYDDFVLQCAELGLRYHPQSFQAMMLRANYYRALLIERVAFYGHPPISDKDKYPELKNLVAKLETLHQQITDSGYEEMPASVYAAWLKSQR